MKETNTKNLLTYQHIGGWLAFYCFTLMIVNPCLYIYNYIIPAINIPIEKIFTYNNSFGVALIILNLLFTIASFAIGFLISSKKYNCIEYAKLYLIIKITIITSVLSLNIIFYYFDNIFLSTISITTKNFLQTLIGFAIWYPYLLYSKRVKLTFKL